MKGKSLNWKLAYLKREFGRYSDFSNRDNIAKSLVVYRLLAKAPMLGKTTIQTQVTERIKKYIKNQYLVYGMALGITYFSIEPAVLLAVSPNIFLGNAEESTQDIVASVEIENPQKVFRQSLNDFLAWYSLCVEYKKLVNNDLIKSAEFNFGEQDDFIDYMESVNESIQKSDSLMEQTKRVFQAVSFDVPIQIILTNAYAQTMKYGASSAQTLMRVLVPFYSVYANLCVLPATNTLYQMKLLPAWKKSLGKDKFEQLKVLTATDPDMMRDRERLERFFKNWE